MATREKMLEVTMFWGESAERVERFAPSQEVRLGADPRASFVLPPEVLVNEVRLATFRDGVWFVDRSAMRLVHVVRRRDGGAFEETAPESTELRLEDDVEVELHLGAFRFYVRTFDRIRKAAPTIDWRVARFVGLSAAFHGALLAIAMLAPPSASALGGPSTTMDRREIDYLLAAVEPDEPRPSAGSTGGASAGGQAMQGEQGKAGDARETRRTGGGVSVRGHDAEPKIPLTREDVRQLATFGVLRSIAIDGPTSPYGAQDARGWADAAAYGPLGANLGFGPGEGGFGMVGVGRGTCPPGATWCGRGTVGLDRLGTMMGSCTRDHFRELERTRGRQAALDACSGMDGSGTRSIGLGPRASRVPRLPVGDVSTTGGLTAEEVRRVIRRNLNQVRFCYEQALNERPDLTGRVATRFLIQPSGAVGGVSVAESSLRNREVESCLTSAVRRWSFPQSPAVTVVTYPFMFQRVDGS